MAPARSKFSCILAKLLVINLDYRDESKDDASILSGSSAEPYIDEEPTTKEWLSGLKPTRGRATRYIRSLFPCWNWIFHYNLQWFMGDLIAGVTVGFVVVPQGMAYALLANLTPEYGLYTSFVGFLLYWAFATSKDITIGTVAVMSTIVGNIVIKVQEKHPDISADRIARGLSVISGSFLLFVGLIRCGWIVEFIPLVAITSFMTGAAISIAVGQVPNMLGIPDIDTRAEPYKVIINTLKALPQSGIDASMGLTALFLLYLIRWICSFMGKRQTNRKKFWFFLSTLRMAFVILLYTMISWLANRNIASSDDAKFKILGEVPRGFQHAGAPVIDVRLIKAFSGDLPATILVLIIEHIAISKSFGRINNYTINPSQELVAIGFTNVLGPFLGGYPATGSFSRTAIKSKAGVRTPFAGMFTAVVVLLALYALTSVFFYIPMASLAGLIIHAVGDLITPPNVVYRFWEVSPIEVVIFFAGVLTTMFTNIENGIYVTIAASAALLLLRIVKAKGRFLGKVKIYHATRDALLRSRLRDAGYDPDETSREVYLPFGHQDGANPNVDVQSPHPGVFVYRFSEGFSYPNQADYLDKLTEHVQKCTRPTKLERSDKLGDRPWNDPGPRRGQKVRLDDDRPILRAIILDFSSVYNVDVTSIQGLIDVRNQLDRHAAPEVVEWHIASIQSRWTKRALAAAGFGYPSTKFVDTAQQWEPLFSVADKFGAIGQDSHLGPRQTKDAESHPSHASPKDDLAIQTHRYQSRDEHNGERRVAFVHGLNRPFFHIDVIAAVSSAVYNASKKDGVGLSSRKSEKVTSGSGDASPVG